jgi:5-methylcytosine-specific restriction endonuclease McrA
MAYNSERIKNSSHWKKIRLSILNRDMWTCAWCGQDADTVDHVIPVKKGGTDDPDNLVAACKRCNFSKGAKVGGVFLGAQSTTGSFRSLLSPTNESVQHE